ncbi:2Fe-2S iron-sulfur cluster binding domain-containing protein [Rhodococcus pseudokoreensis]|uniref:2Fe-2S iron-sulfur cluster binding domain-containing protein n=1 Tax=Rhodococcus pseudokoreensis TaxID=2811421 RepID=A0A974W2C9_9NOCA|nr:2Fe-2S iron-sulfur cluster-binding protein [Rhodococcus pseudokoreensis]QSE89432.1 2Fe-2S iron-sulfur cluster binding domain-containing protein [Rhodococcus pseudokoreensis]
MANNYTVRIQGKNSDVTVAEDQSILDAALRANEWLPHSCTQGTCGTCKLKVLCGEVNHNESPEYTLTAGERADGLVLGCMATPRSDLTVEPLGGTGDDGVPHFPLRDYDATVVVLEDIAANTRRLVVELDTPMLFNAGQYAELIVPEHNVGRQYSMANPPTETRRLEFHVKLTPEGLATERWIFGPMQVGDRLSLRGPLGQFNLVKEQDEPAILIGGGTGLAPLKSIVQHALAERLVPELYLYHGGRRQEDLYDVEFFRGLAREHEHFHYRPALSEEQWDGAMGMVTDVVLDDFSSCKGMSAYLCGPPPMVEAAVKALKRRRMAPRLIFREEFTVAAPNLAAVVQ